MDLQVPVKVEVKKLDPKFRTLGREQRHKALRRAISLEGLPDTVGNKEAVLADAECKARIEGALLPRKAKSGKS